MSSKVEVKLNENAVKLCKFVPAHSEGAEWVPDSWVPMSENNAMEEVRNLKHDFDMYRKAWRRELGCYIIPKTHEIDELVVSTQFMRERLEELKKKQAEVNLLLNTPSVQSEYMKAVERIRQLENALLPFANYWQVVWERTAPKDLYAAKENKVAHLGRYEGPTNGDCFRAYELLNNRDNNA